jgi:NADPH-dependent glutamate synthase beta subunit-like oxidoreductase/glutamate synthase domain-containing protein 3/Pyruvate/2-oxoacid:ferredoxin oxidoreductase delta subunit
MKSEQFITISGRVDGQRLDSRILEENIQKALEKGHTHLQVEAHGQHGIGGRLWNTASENIHMRIEGPTGQRLGSLGYPNTHIEVMGPVSDDVGWLNAGARITVYGNASNGVANGMAQGIVSIAGSIGSRGMTMTKHNPRFDPPELWVLGSVGDYFGEFMAGGIAVVCGHNPQNPDSVLGYRPLVGMVGGKVYFRGPQKGFSETDAKLLSPSDEDWSWLDDNLRSYLDRIGQPELFSQLAQREAWQLLVAKTPQERVASPMRTMHSFRREVWDATLGAGGIVGDLTDLDRSAVPVVTRGALRRFIPLWENRQYKAPCENACPSGIPVQERWRLVREGRLDEAVDLALEFTPFPATVCGYLCPNPCMDACTKNSFRMAPVDITKLGQASIDAGVGDLPPLSGKRVAVIGGGPAGISLAWQLRKMGHEATIYDDSPALGGKIASVIPHSRIPKKVFEAEIDRVEQVIPQVQLKKRLDQKATQQLVDQYDYVVIAAGAQKPRSIPIPGADRMTTALEFLIEARQNRVAPGKRVVIIGAGNVGCDVATEASRLGAEDITLLDIQEPASFGKEREDAEAVGAIFRWPVVTREISAEGVVLEDGEVIPADTVVISIGDAPDLDFLPQEVAVEAGFITVDETYRTSHPKIYAIGDIIRPGGLITDAIGAGRRTAETIDALSDGREPPADIRKPIAKERTSQEYFSPRITIYDTLEQCGRECSSCGQCRDCHICEEICPENAIHRWVDEKGAFEYQVNEERCIGCGFCSGACPCGVWNLVPNQAMG